MSTLPATRADLEALLRERHLHAEAPPLRGTAPRALPLPTGVGPLDLALGGGLPRGQMSEAFGPVSSGRTGVAMGLLVGVTSRGGLAALVDPADRFDPASAHGAGIDLDRLLWVRGPGRSGSTGLSASTAAAARLVESGLFEIVVLDLVAHHDGELQRLPAATWLRLQRSVAHTRAVLLLLARHHVAHGPGGVSVALEPRGGRFRGANGSGRLLTGLAAEAVAGRNGFRRAPVELVA
jgi:hypothetical protein